MIKKGNNFIIQLVLKKQKINTHNNRYCLHYNKLIFLKKNLLLFLMYLKLNE